MIMKVNDNTRLGRALKRIRITLILDLCCESVLEMSVLFGATGKGSNNVSYVPCNEEL